MLFLFVADTLNTGFTAGIIYEYFITHYGTFHRRGERCGLALTALRDRPHNNR